MSEAESGRSGAAMAAYVVVAVDEEAATQVLRHMDEASIGILTAAMSEMHEPSRDEGVQIYARLMAELEAGGAIASGGFDAFESLLSRAFGDKRAHDMLERIIRTRTSDLDILSKIDGRTLADQVKDERPQLLAVLLGRMILGERLSRPALMTLLSAVTGAVIMLWDTDRGLPSPQDRADWLAISSGLAFALSNNVKKIKNQKNNSNK